jgi:hypothetical protein
MAATTRERHACREHRHCEHDPADLDHAVTDEDDLAERAAERMTSRSCWEHRHVSVGEQKLTKRMRELGAPDPADWARSEVEEGIAQQARFLFLRAIWPTMIEPLANPSVMRRYPAVARLLDAGADQDDLSRALRAVAYETAFGVVERLDEGYDADAPDDAPGWILMETTGEAMTGRDMGGLHESLQSLDPSGREALDLFE